jgi:hypothetical protein
MTEDSIAKMVALASSSGYSPTAKVRIGDGTVIEVVDSENFVASMEPFLRDVASGRVSLPDEAPSALKLVMAGPGPRELT